MGRTRPIELTEWQSVELRLRPDELASLHDLAKPASLTIEAIGDSLYCVTPGSIVGAVARDGIALTIAPKLAPERFFLLLAYSRDFDFLADEAVVDADLDLVEGFVAVFLNTLQRAMRRGLLSGYQRYEEMLPTVRGRVRFADQQRRHFGLPLPVEVAFDDYTADIEANRVLKAALTRCAGLPLRAHRLRTRLHEALGAFVTVSDIRYHPQAIPEVRYTRLNQHFKAPTELARLVLRHTSINLGEGASAISGLLINMNDVFEDFIYFSIGDRLVRTELGPEFRWMHEQVAYLDERGSVAATPDLSLWEGADCRWVGDAKYKVTSQGLSSDLYQLLAYCAATNLPAGTLLYAETMKSRTEHQVVHGGPTLIVEGIDLTAPLPDLWARCDEVAANILQTVGQAAGLGSLPPPQAASLA